jgi:hypothetical protein
MIRKLLLILIITGFSTGFVSAQSFVKTSDLFSKTDENPSAGHLNIIQNPEIDTLISRYILMNKNLKEKNGYYGMEGCRIQIYSSSNRNAKVESRNAMAEFSVKFPDITSYELFEGPAWYKIRVGDFRTKTEATKLFLLISKEFPDAYIVQKVFINFPDLNTK